jgi:hypothetical protein
VTQETFCIDSMLKHCAANRKRRHSALPNISPYIYMTLKFLALQDDISRLRVNTILNSVQGPPRPMAYPVILLGPGGGGGAEVQQINLRTGQ